MGTIYDAVNAIWIYSLLVLASMDPILGSGFKAAVYEHVVISPTDAQGHFTRDEAFNWMKRNLDVYEKQVAIAAGEGTNIIVFPEYGITGFNHARDSMVPFLEDIPDTSANWNPCRKPTCFKHTKVLYTLSCMAAKYNLYIVANMGDIKTCNANSNKNCPADNRFQFNTNVVFDHRGVLVARYHKYHLYDETPLFDPAPEVELSIFDTPYGKFATVVCFDILHYYPTQVLLEERGIRNLVVTSAWNVFYPFVIPTQMYSGLARRNGIRVIASNMRCSDFIMAGSGIFGDGVEVSTDPDYTSPNGELIIAEFPDHSKVSSASGSVDDIQPLFTRRITGDSVPSNTDFSQKYDYGMNASFAILDEQAGSDVVCFGVVCCAVEYEFKTKAADELYVLGASDFELVYPGVLHMQFCAVHRCESREISTCGKAVATSKSSFSKLKLQGFFDGGIKFPFIATSPYDNITIDLEMTNYKFDKRNAILESDHFVHPLLSAVLFNSAWQPGTRGPVMGASSGANKLDSSVKCQTFIIMYLHIHVVVHYMFG